MKARTFLIVAAALLAGACTGTPVRLGSPSDQPLPTGAARDISASACGFQLLLLIPIQTNNRLTRAYRALSAQAAGDYITDVEVQEEWGYRFVGTQYCTHLRAKAIRTA